MQPAERFVLNKDGRNDCMDYRHMIGSATAAILVGLEASCTAGLADRYTWLHG